MNLDLKKNCQILYIFMMIGTCLQVTFVTSLIGLAVWTAAIFMAYAQRDKTDGAFLHSHFTWIIRTFWIGTGVYMPILILLATLIFYTQIDSAALMQKMASGAIQDVNQLQATLRTEYGVKFLSVGLLCAIPFLGWFLWRFVQGYRLLQAEHPIPHPYQWI